jgi:DDE superfamily endonuclease
LSIGVRRIGQKKTKAFVETLGGRLRLFFLPPYSPDRNPDELVWKHLKADTVGRTVVTDKVDFKRKVISAMRSLQRSPGTILFILPKTAPALCRVNVNILLE